jgi:hypothetical protein
MPCQTFWVSPRTIHSAATRGNRISTILLIGRARARKICNVMGSRTEVEAEKFGAQKPPLLGLPEGHEHNVATVTLATRPVVASLHYGPFRRSRVSSAFFGSFIRMCIFASFTRSSVSLSSVVLVSPKIESIHSKMYTQLPYRSSLL